MPNLPELARPLIRPAVELALLEDLGRAGDVTSHATLPSDITATAIVNAREPGRIAGIDVAREAFRQIDSNIEFEAHVADGDRVRPGSDVVRVSGRARHILAAERVALNFMCHMTGIATCTSDFVEAITGTNAKICCTRKTTPGMRAFEKYAVRCGGGSNHRFGLDDAILIKDNHIAVAGDIGKAVNAARKFAGHMVVVEVEVDTIEQLAEAIDAGATAVLLDNLSPADLRAAVKINGGRARLEASGNIDISSVRDVAETGVDFISTSKITMGAMPLDLGLDVITS